MKRASFIPKAISFGCPLGVCVEGVVRDLAESASHHFPVYSLSPLTLKTCPKEDEALTVVLCPKLTAGVHAPAYTFLGTVPGNSQHTTC